MKISKLNHIAIACRDIEKHLKLFGEIFGMPSGDVVEVPSQGVKVVFLELPNVRIELIAPLDDKANLNKFLEKRGEGLHHISLAVDDIKAAMTELSGKGVSAIDSEPRPGADKKLVAFLHPKSTGGVLIELEED
jgi:methylmalonyl-CoA/ethylmalonyl-CoA epimerase